MRSRFVRTAVPVAVLAAAALSLTACSSHDSSADATGNVAATSSGSPAPSTPTGTDDTAAGGSGGTTSSDGRGAADAATGSASHPKSHAAGARTAACATSQLRVTKTGDDAAAGQIYTKIVFTNTAGSACTLTGYPGVSYVKGAGVQSGNPAQRTGAAYHTVTLAAHGSASAVLHDSNGLGGYTKAQCQLTSVEGLRIYPPNQKAALFLPWRTQHCAGTSIHPLTTGPVQG